MKNIIVVLLITLLPSLVCAGNMATLYECDPSPVFRGTINPNQSRAVLLRNYSGTITQAEWGACEIAVKVKIAREKKKVELWDETEKRVHVYLPGVNLISVYHLWASIDNKTPDAAMSSAIEYYNPWKSARDTLNNFTGIASITAFDAITGLP